MPHAYPFPTPMPVLPGVWKVRISALVAGRYPSGNDMAFQLTTTGIPPTDAYVAGVFGTQWTEHVAPVLATDYAGQEVSVYNLKTAHEPQVSIPLTVSGSALGSPTAVTNGANIHHDLGVRRKHSRSMIGPIPINGLDPNNNNLTTPTQTAIQEAWDTFVLGVNSDVGFAVGIARVGTISLITNKLYTPQFFPWVTSSVKLPLGHARRRAAA